MRLSIFIAVLPTAISALRYLPFGDSITDYGCWRPQLAQALQQNHNITLDFVGTRKAQATCLDGQEYDRDHEGHPGYQTVNIAKNEWLVEWLALADPDIVSMHLGTVDTLRAPQTTTEDIINAYTALVQQMRYQNPRMRILLAQIIPHGPPEPIDTKVESLNKAIPAWAASLNTTESPIWVVDQFTGFSPTTDLYDGIHPSASGDVKIAERWEIPMVLAVRSLQDPAYKCTVTGDSACQ